MKGRVCENDGLRKYHARTRVKRVRKKENSSLEGAEKKWLSGQGFYRKGGPGTGVSIF